MFRIKRFVDPNAGWSVKINWKPNGWDGYYYSLRLYGVHHPGAWSRFTLLVYEHGGFGQCVWVVASPVFGDLREVTSHRTTREPRDPSWDAANVVRFPAVPCHDFWKLAQAVRQQKDQGAAAALVDWLCENGPSFLTGILQEGPPLDREVGATAERQ